MSQVSLFLSLA